MTRMTVDEANRHWFVRAGMLSGEHVGRSVWIQDGEDRYGWELIVSVVHGVRGVVLVTRPRRGVTRRHRFDPATSVDVTAHREADIELVTR